MHYKLSIRFENGKILIYKQENYSSFSTFLADFFADNPQYKSVPYRVFSVI